MRSVVILAAISICAALAHCDATVAATSASPVVAACANPALPQAILAGPSPSRTSWTMPLPVITATGARMPLTLAVASDERSRDLGLMCVTHLRPQRGMIFVFDGPTEQEFWMKNTLIPLDMLWVGADGRITTIADHVPASTRATPETKVARRRGFGAFVIELRAGEAAVDGLTVGTRLSLGRLIAK